MQRQLRRFQRLAQLRLGTGVGKLQLDGAKTRGAGRGEALRQRQLGEEHAQIGQKAGHQLGSRRRAASSRTGEAASRRRPP